MQSNRTQGLGRVRALTAAVALAVGSSAMAAAPLWVTSGDDSGPGTLRESLASGASNIRIASQVGSIDIDSTLVYEGTRPLKIDGIGQTVFANNTGDDFTLLEIADGANVSIYDLNFDGGGGFSLDNRGDGKGVFVRVPEDRTGVVRVELKNVRVNGVANHGIHVSDCTLGDDCGAGSGGGGDGSPASIVLTADRVSVVDAGNGKFDADGIRIEAEDGDGTVHVIFSNSVATGNEDDGLDLSQENTAEPGTLRLFGFSDVDSIELENVVEQ